MNIVILGAGQVGRICRELRHVLFGIRAVPLSWSGLVIHHGLLTLVAPD